MHLKSMSNLTNHITCFNKQNSIYIKPTSTRSVLKFSPGSSHFYTHVYMHQIRSHWSAKYDFLLHIHHRHKAFFVLFKVYSFTPTFKERQFSVL